MLLHHVGGLLFDATFHAAVDCQDTDVNSHMDLPLAALRLQADAEQQGCDCPPPPAIGGYDGSEGWSTVEWPDENES